MAKLSLNEQAKEIIKIAEASGVQSNFLFTTTFDRYLQHIKLCEEYKKQIAADGLLVTKEYVKNRKNLYINPAVDAYNKAADAANKDVSTILKIIKTFNVSEDSEDEDPLMKIINGGGASE